MNDLITPPPTPYKALGYNQTDYIITIIASFLFIFFFAADDLFGAAGLRAVYKGTGFLVAYVALLFIPLLFAVDGTISRRDALYLSGLITLCGLVVAPFIIILAGVSVLSESIRAMFPRIPTASLLGIPGIAYLIIVGLWLRQKARRDSIMKFATLMTLLFTAVIATTANSSLTNINSKYQGSLTLKDHRYFLYLRIYQDLIDESSVADWLELYECNSIGLGCRVVNSSLIASPSFRKIEDGDIVMVADRAQNEVRVLFNDEVIFTHRPDDD